MDDWSRRPGAHAEAHCGFSACRVQAGNNIYRSNPWHRGGEQRIKVHHGTIQRENGIVIDRRRRPIDSILHFATNIRPNHRQSSL